MIQPRFIVIFHSHLVGRRSTTFDSIELTGREAYPLITTRDDIRTLSGNRISPHEKLIMAANHIQLTDYLVDLPCK